MHNDVTKLFEKHEVNAARVPDVDATREAFKALYTHVLTLQGGRSRDEAVKKLEEAFAWLVQGIDGEVIS